MVLKLSPPAYRYCPFCASSLTDHEEGQQLRKQCPTCQWIYYPHVAAAAGAVIVSPLNQVLMVKRNRQPYQGTWMFPAGFVEFGEHPSETMIREVKEETSLTVTHFEFLNMIQSPDDPRAVGLFMFFYMVNKYHGTLSFDSEENSAAEWFSLNDLPEIGWWAHKEIVQQLAKLLSVPHGV